MSTRLIQHLKNKCEADANVAILYAQWEFDQKLVGKALENIGGFYPHFSNHNASHSQQILVNIERILGDDVDLLSATDTWLILEAAYWHDVGMLVDAKNAKEVHTNPDFNFMIQTIANEKGHDLQKFCQAYVENGWLSAIGTLDHPFDGVEKYRQLIAEWFRRGHDKRVGKLVEDPFKDLGITSPRTELLPNRIYRYLGQICVSHGMNFSNLMETLPYKQTGLGTENCHPKFIGCLLRLGDLFDLDDNRFCPVMAKHVSNMPSVSKHHHDKHLSLREFQLDKRTVKLVAECPDEMSYVETQNWFGWIREEFQNQMSQWNLIVPDLKFGSLPTIEQLDVKIAIRYEEGIKKEKILLDNKPMQFTLDQKSVIEILEGRNIYQDEISVFREIIQNAIDATLMRVWIENIKVLQSNHNPYDEIVRGILDQYLITVNFNKIRDIEGSRDSIWEISIIDNGIGISINDLMYMQKIAGSKNNISRQKIISSMPLWMKPSGSFGIGLHSGFLLAKDLDIDNKILIRTKSIFTNEILNIELYSPLGNKKGYCFIEKIPSSLAKAGTEIKIKFLIKEDSFFSEKTEYAKRENIFEEDYVLKERLNIIGKIKKIQSEISKESLIPIQFSKKLLHIFPYDFEANSRIKSFKIWDKRNQISIDIEYKPNISFLGSKEGNLKLYFKGQRIYGRYYQNLGLEKILSLFIVKFDIYAYDAKEILNINRDDWNRDKLNSIDFFKILKDNFLNNKNELEKKLKETELLILGYLLEIYNFDVIKNNKKILKLNLNELGKNNLTLDMLIKEDNYAISQGLTPMNLLKEKNNSLSIRHIVINNSNIISLVLNYIEFYKKEIYVLKNNLMEFYFIPSDNINFKENYKKYFNFDFIEYKDRDNLNITDYIEKLIDSYSRSFGKKDEGQVLYIPFFDEVNYLKKLVNKENRLIFPWYFVGNGLVKVDIEYLIKFLLSSNFFYEKDINKNEVRKLYQNFIKYIEKSMEKSDIWKKAIEKGKQIK
ncbi:HD domain-containing protein [Acinetobacter schindleri]|uniref:HD domain-containing protein n=2 Tax=Acinetobacter schindleri TaxID=108981 RepID=UPI0009728CBB|nr:ATP-binding protein [Acinetobacter schindleri]APX61666.1 ATPase domain-containing protein [Acinetobacter schindleri]